LIWRFRHINRKLAARLANDLGQPLKVGEFLVARGFKDPASVRNFIRAELKALPDPLTLKGMNLALDRLLLARRQGELTAICGDYDADGLTAAALLGRGLRESGLKITIHIPNRLTDGYGLKPTAVSELAKRGVSLIVTVDNGVSDLEAVETATHQGLDVIITDHHQLPLRLPPALTIINPHNDEAWGKAPPAGVGMAFFLLAAFKRHLQKNNLLTVSAPPALLDYLPLVAIGTIADLAPLTGANRILVRQGLDFLASTSWPGLAALKKISRITGKKISGRDVGFRLAPRLNAAGRLGSAGPALELLLSEDEESAAKLAVHLEKLNQKRYQGQNRLCQEALEKLEVEISPNSRTVVLGEKDWPRGLLGLAASRVAETTRKPTVLFSLEGILAVGSGRSAGNFNLYRALSHLEPMFTSFGGHAQAAGLTLPVNRLNDFRTRLEDLAQAEPDFVSESELLIDLVVSLGDLEILARPLAAMEPFGQANSSPILVIPRVSVGDARPTNSGGEQHLKFVLLDGLIKRTLIGFGLAPRLCEITREMDVALTLEMNEYQGCFTPSWRILDFRPSERLNL